MVARVISFRIKNTIFLEEILMIGFQGYLKAIKQYSVEIDSTARTHCYANLNNKTILVNKAFKSM